MDSALSIGTDKLLQAIQQEYGLDIINLEFLLRGFGGDCYRCEAHNGNNYFLKVHDPVNNQMMAASSRAFYLPLMAQVHAQRILPDIPHPLQTLDGAHSFRIGVNELVITNFIEGNLVGFGRLSEQILAPLAEQVGVLHNCRDQLEFERPFIDQFEIVFEQDLIDAFPRLVALEESASPGQLLLRESIFPHQRIILAALQKLQALQAIAQESCSTELL